MDGSIGSAMGRLGLDTGPFEQGIDRAANKAAGFERAVQSSSGGMTGWANAVVNNKKQLTTWGKTLVGVGGAITGSLAAPILAGSKAAWTQVDAVEQATVALKAYEPNVEAVNAVLADLIKYAQSDTGVLFQRTDLFEAAQSLKLYGDETENLSKHTQILSRSVGLGLANWHDMNRIIGRVGSTGKLTSSDFDYLRSSGYDLDESLRGANVTFESLFEAMDKGMPESRISGQADTIRGKFIRMQSAMRNVGLAFLGVDGATSTFIKGGIGDQLVKMLENARTGFNALVPAARIFGSMVAGVMSIVSGFINVMLSLPSPIQTAIVVFAGLTGALMTASGTFLLLLPRIANTYLALQRFGGTARIINTVSKAFRTLSLASPWMLAITAAVAAFLAYKNNFLGFRDGVDAVVRAIKNLSIVQSVIGWFKELMGVFGAFSDAFKGLDTKKDIELTMSGDDKVMEWVENAEALDGTGFDYMVRIKNDDGSLEEFGQVIESYTDESDPNIAHILVKTDEGEYWTTVDKTTGVIGDGTIMVDADVTEARNGFQRLRDGLTALKDAAEAADMPFLASMASGAIKAISGVEKLVGWFRNLNPVIQQIAVAAGVFLIALKPLAAVVMGVVGAMSPLLTVAKAVGVALAFLTSPIGLVVVSVAALAAGAVYAYKNIEPFRKAVNASAKAVKGFVLGPVVDGFKALGNGVKDAYNWVRKVAPPLAQTGRELASLARSRAADVFTTVASAVATAYGHIRDFVRSVADLSAIFGAVMGVVRSFGSAVQSALSGVISVVMAVVSLIRGDFAGAWGHLQDAARSAIEAVVGIMTALPSAIIAIFAAISWGDLWTGLQDGAKAAFEGLKDLGSMALSALRAAFDAIPWASLFDGITTAVAAIPGLLGDLAGVVMGWISSAAGAISWDSLISGAAGLASRALGLLGDLASTVISWIADAVPDAEQWESLLNNAGDILSGLGGKIGDLTAWVVNWITDAIPSLDTWRDLVSQAGDIITGLSGKLGDLIAWAVKWITDAIPGLDTWRQLVSQAGDIVTGLSSKLGNLIQWVVKWITDAIPSLETWRQLVSLAGDIITGLSGKLGDLAAWAVKWITDAAPSLETWRKLVSLAGDIVTGLSKKLGDLKAWAVKWITEAAPKAADWLKLLTNAAKFTAESLSGMAESLINAIKGAVEAAWEGLKGWAQGLWDKLTGWLFGGGDTEVDLGSGAVAGAVGEGAISTNFDATDVSQKIVDAIGNSLSGGGLNASAITDGLAAIFAQASSTTAGGQLDGAARNVGQNFIYALVDYFENKTSGKTLGDGIGSALREAGAETGSYESPAKAVGETFLKAMAEYFTSGTGGTTLSTGIAAALRQAATKAEGFEGAAKAVGEKFLKDVAEYFTSGTGGTTLSTGIASAMKQAAENATGFDGAAKAVGEKFLQAMAEYFSGGTSGATISPAIAAAMTQAAANAEGFDGAAKAVGEKFLQAMADYFSGSTSGATLSPAIAAALQQAAANATGFDGAAKAVGEEFIRAAADYLGGGAPGSLLGTGISAAFRAGVSSVTGTIKASATTLGESASAAMAQGILNVLSTVTSAVTAWNTQVTNITNTIKSNATSVGTATTAAAAQGMLNALSAFTASVQAWNTAVNNIRGTITSSARNVGQATTQSAADAMRSNMGTFNAAVNGWVTAVNGVVGAMRGAGQSAGRAASDAATGAVQSGRGAIGGAAGSWSGAVSGAGGGMYSAGYNVGAQASRGVADGLYSELGSVTAAANAIVDQVRRAMNARAEIRSPSRMTQRIAELMGEGVVVGLEAMLSQVRAAAENVVDSLKDGLMASPLPSLEPGVTMPQIGRMGDYLRSDPYIPDPALAYGFRTSPAVAPTVGDQRPNITILTLAPDEWVRVAEAAERGGSYAVQMSSPDAITQYLGE